MKNPKQTEFVFHGGRRKNAGRKKQKPTELPHVRRVSIDSRTPAHITLRVNEFVPGLRTPKFIDALLEGIEKAKAFGLRVNEFALLSNHLHLIIEADSKAALTSGMQSLMASIRWALKRVFRYCGRIFVSRFHLQLLKTPRQVRNAIKYVVFNHAKHTGMRPYADAFSSASVSQRACEIAGVRRLDTRPPWHQRICRALSDARTWLQVSGWRRAR